MKDLIQWTTPSPLWEIAISQNTAQLRRAELSRPTILRFATDSFMDDFLKMAENDPARLNQYIALPETWRGVAPMPEALNPAPAFAKNFKRLGLISARKSAKINGLTGAPNKFTAFANSTATNPLKLYQPAHQRFYMISACLVCERPGLPDKIPDGGREEKVTYVIRRLFPKTLAERDDPPNSTWEEFAYVLTDQGARWKKASNKNSLEKDEEQQPLFSINITEDDGRRRKIFAGVIPTGRREAYIAAGEFSEKKPPDPNNPNAAPDPNAPIDSRVYLMRSQFRDPWRNLLQSAAHAQKAFLESCKKDPNDGENVAARRDIVKNAREQIQTVSWLILLDFATFLEENMPRIWTALKGQAVSPALIAEEDALVKVLKETTLATDFEDNLKVGVPSDTQVSGSLQAALITVKATAQIGKDLEAVVKNYDRGAPDPLYPKFLFPLADPGFDPTINLPVPPNSSPSPLNPNFLLKTRLNNVPVSITPTNFNKTSENQKKPPPNPLITDGEDHVNAIAGMIGDVLKKMPQNQPLMMPPLASQVPMDMREGWFVIRCVYERPLCGTIDPPVLSEPTKRFQIAGFFDPDAPARPIRIGLPVDTTPAGLRKFDRNTAFMMSDLLCGQVNRMKGITFADLVFSILPWPFHRSLDVPDAGGCKEGNMSVGMMCSLSIPIITICALILLMIIVALLDFIFKWLPFLIFCFPLPGLKAKK